MGDTTEQRVGLGVSVALHLLVVLYILRAPVVTVPETTTIDVTFEAPQTAPQKQQIVSPPESKAEKPPENTDRLSDVDATAIKEQIKRGTEGGLPNPPAKPQPPPASTRGGMRSSYAFSISTRRCRVDQVRARIDCNSPRFRPPAHHSRTPVKVRAAKSSLRRRRGLRRTP